MHTLPLLTLLVGISQSGKSMPSSKPPMKAVHSMHWFRRGLRLHDNPALLACLDQNPSKFYPVYLMDGDSYQLLRCTALRANFLVETLKDLDESLRKIGSRLYVLNAKEDDPIDMLTQKWEEWGITHLSFEEDETGEPYATQRDNSIIEAAEKRDIKLHSVASETMYPLNSYMKKAGEKGPPATMTSFQKIFKSMPEMKGILMAPRHGSLPDNNDNEETSDKYLPPRGATDLPWPRNVPRDDVESVWGPADCKSFTPIVHGGETQALITLEKSLRDATWVAQFEKPKTSCTSVTPSTTVLSPYLSWGCLSPRQVWYAVEDALKRTNKTATKPPVSLHGQLLWRDFNNLMAHDANLKAPGCWNIIKGNKYCRQIAWDDDPLLLEKWKAGKTGYPWIDACMRQLAIEGWIHHLGRHAVACFLTRGDLWQSWEHGARHFEAQLLDADYALNGFNWMWLSCSGFFYQYFRCYSPIAFQKKNDPTGAYIRKFCPELKKLPDKYIYEPWTAPPAVLKTAGIKLGKDYPLPIVEHKSISKANMSRMKQAYEDHKQVEKSTPAHKRAKTAK